MLLLRDARSCHIGRPTSITFPATQHLTERGTNPCRSGAEHYRVMIRPGQSEAAGVDDRELDSRQREHRQQMGGAPDVPGQDRVDEQRARRDGDHQHDPDPSERPMPSGSFRLEPRRHGRSGGGEIKAVSKLFLQGFPNLGLFSARISGIM